MNNLTSVPRFCGYTVSVIRFIVSGLFAAAPSVMMSEMFGLSGKSRVDRLAVWHYVIRDLLLGLGLLRALRGGRNTRGWMLAGTAADVIDLGAIAATQPDPRKRSRLLAGMAGVVVTDAALTVLLRDNQRSAAR